ncbi:hypothetical protein [Baaleninema simplex]|uniref:hypothetical protein n=1 Tax=Baaleninema simplex TaxID=2862350 RepID=UPI00037D97E1|nr:hypothetical protein [Baaleninema simplex]
MLASVIQANVQRTEVKMRFNLSVNPGKTVSPDNVLLFGCCLGAFQKCKFIGYKLTYSIVLRTADANERLLFHSVPPVDGSVAEVQHIQSFVFLHPLRCTH